MVGSEVQQYAMDLTWLFLILCPYMLLYFYLCDYTEMTQYKINIYWSLGLLIIVLAWLLINALFPNPLPFPAPLFRTSL